MQTDTWITISTTDVENYISNAELAAALTTSLASGQTSPLAQIIVDVTEEVRGYARARNTIGAAGTIPLELKTKALDVILYRVANRLRKKVIAADYKPDAERALAFFEGPLAEGKFKITAPLNVTTDVTSAPGPSFERPQSAGFGYREERGV